MEEPARPIKRIAVSTGGGDAPGLNAVIRAVVLAGRNRDWDVVGIRDGFNGLMYPERYRDGGIVQLPREAVRGIVHLGGTILGTTNRGNPTAYPVRQPDGSYIEVDRTDELVKLFAIRDIDALVTIGGDGSLSIANVSTRPDCESSACPRRSTTTSTRRTRRSASTRQSASLPNASTACSRRRRRTAG